MLLIILDGWGISPSWGGNALVVNSPKNINRLWRDFPHKVLQAFTMVAGKYGVVGDSRLGHSTIAAGRRLPQDLEIISESIADKSFYRNPVLTEAIEKARKRHTNLHLVGLLSNGGIHAHLNHLKALLELAYRKNFDRVYLDLFTDGIDSGEYDALNFLEIINRKILECGIGKYSSVIGRFYAMDRIGDFGRTRKTFELLIEAKGKEFVSPAQAISQAYREGLNDFKMTPSVIIDDGQSHQIKDGDSVIFFNFRSDRMSQLLGMFLGKAPKKLFYKRPVVKNLHLVTLTELEKDLPLEIAFQKKEIPDTLGEILSKHQIKQLRVAESEKAAHVTSFFNCGRDEAFAGETRRILPSRNIDPLKAPQ
ncbi:MAG TPA: 2,3-bisphosphoglycerate-independent phosphoglycerate mutase, partial [Patescibacteria group bacterium]|nr:2,3-bisphosphoglycerate-independent phosphoglycerate mutase [Patescibacteria group bacterium]